MGSPYGGTGPVGILILALDSFLLGFVAFFLNEAAFFVAIVRRLLLIS
jgi:hypothetical protein